MKDQKPYSQIKKNLFQKQFYPNQQCGLQLVSTAITDAKLLRTCFKIANLNTHTQKKSEPDYPILRKGTVGLPWLSVRHCNQ